MSKLIVMPKLGLTMVEGKVSKWHKKEGDEVKKGDLLFEVETDKITNRVEADQDGILRKVFVQQGENAPVTAPVAILAGRGEDISSLCGGDTGKVEITATGTKEAAEKVKEVVSVTRKEGEYVKASPYAKSLAKEKSIDLAGINGTGEGGRILAKNVLEYVQENKVKISPTAAKMAKEMGVDVTAIDAKGRVMKEDILSAVGMGEEISAIEDKVEKVAPSNMRKVIAKRMLESWTTSPRVTYNMEVDVTGMKEFRDKLKDSFNKAGGKLTYNHILIKIASKALLEVPYLNASFDGEEIEFHHYVNIGLAVDVGEGLMVPNIKNVQDKSLLDIAVETEAMVTATREGTITPDNLSGGTFTISNIGMFGIDSFSPIINKPEVAILGINRIVEKPIALDGQIVIRPMMNLSLSADHSLVDGAMAARFLARFKEIIENPYLLLM
ncbi:2-oxo acid dehydrogenase subunit E2 [Alkaliphilus sp. MSJ-5]|uniref:Dihydrolipoamide acetyltransferase component of pyruvate dehydrogenase complex n=1 Tax=Alkaliphilus flagellatus TaxID=2841507 RepID=A0ABS6G9X9_9FIRM|nr:dihydrolipoamide acetyltransferase family protein [Alkaliphilus flagellatus]MBU5678195.1 2-oxo acid dehydrogenase subunit E2 [Alkaliphilus flagellatus]